MKKIAIIGAGISGLSSGLFLKDKYEVTIFEKDKTPGGLIKCKEVNGSLFHTCGGHVFNTKLKDISDWFWSIFSKEDFVYAERNSSIVFNDDIFIPYPIENHLCYLPENIQKDCIKDLIKISQVEKANYSNFGDFLKNKFGQTLFNVYFEPYNKKIWNTDLSKVPTTWLDGKLPTPNIEDIIYSNINHQKEESFVHSSFWYEKKRGSQFIADKLAKGQNILFGSNIDHIEYNINKWIINESVFDMVVFCGNIKDLPNILYGIDLSDFLTSINGLKFHGTTSVFCEIDNNPYSWVYLPSSKYRGHRIICTGNFSKENNACNITTGTVEFTDYISKEDIIINLSSMPLHPKYIDHVYNECTYPIQDKSTRELIASLKSKLKQKGFYLTGRFAEWEYYNMDAAINAAKNTCTLIP